MNELFQACMSEVEEYYREADKAVRELGPVYGELKAYGYTTAAGRILKALTKAHGVNPSIFTEEQTHILAEKAVAHIKKILLPAGFNL